jgi:hypothetical protein
MVLKDWKKTRSGWRKGLQEIFIREYEMDDGGVLYSLKIVGDRGWTSEYNVTIKNSGADSRDKKKVIAYAKDYMRKH